MPSSPFTTHIIPDLSSTCDFIIYVYLPVASVASFVLGISLATTFCLCYIRVSRRPCKTVRRVHLTSAVNPIFAHNATNPDGVIFENSNAFQLQSLSEFQCSNAAPETAEIALDHNHPAETVLMSRSTAQMLIRSTGPQLASHSTAQPASHFTAQSVSNSTARQASHFISTAQLVSQRSLLKTHSADQLLLQSSVGKYENVPPSQKVI